MFNGLLILSVFVTSNLLLTRGFGVLDLQRNKSSKYFTLVNSLLVAVTIICISSIYKFLYSSVLEAYRIQPLGSVIIVLLSGIFCFVAMQILKLINKEMYYYYDSTYSYIINLGVVVGVMFSMDWSLEIIDTIKYSGLVALSYIAVTMIFAFVYNRLHNKKVSRIIRPVPITIVTVAILAMIVYAISISI